MPLEFRYFRAPESEMGFLPGSRVCSLCGQPGRCLPLDGVDILELSEEGRKDKIGCYNCLRRDRFGFSHDTEVGLIVADGLISDDEQDDAPTRVFVVATGGETVAGAAPLVHPLAPYVSEEAIAELRRTPSFSTWQEVAWPVHCDDFMAYLGIWGPEDFAEAAPEGAGRPLFLEMVDSFFHKRWPAERGPRFGQNFVAFQCLHCQTRTGIWDID